MPSSSRPARRPAFVPFDRGEIEQSIARRFEQQVDRDPHRPAVKFDAVQWSYAELDAAANRIAHALLAAVGRGPRPIVLLIGQSPELVAGILGVLKSGNTYVPLETWHAPAYVAAVVAESRAALIVADEAGAALAAAASPATPVLTLADADAHSAQRPGNEVSPDALAYVYYTSGTTGRAKGVADSHRNVLHNVMRYTNSLGFDRDDRLTLLQSPSFSGAVSSLFGAVLNGATLFPYDVRQQGPAGLGRWLVRERITAYHSVPALFRQAMAGAPAFPDLRLVRIEGDAMSRLDWELFTSRCMQGAFLVNGLGATECGLVRQFFIAHGTPAAEGVVPIGYAVPDMEVRVVDDAGNGVVVGEVGEIAVRSRFLARGYWLRDELTARAFGADPGNPAMRTYRTGDLGRLRSDGVAESAVRVFENRSGDVDLVGYVVPVRYPPPAREALRRHLLSRVPAHAVPSRFETFERLPLNSHGKVDRAALPRPLPSRSRLATAYRAPGTDLEQTVAEVWRGVLGIHEPGIDDSFFDLGGTSLGLGRVQARLEGRLGRTIPMAALFEHPTIAGLARSRSTHGRRASRRGGHRPGRQAGRGPRQRAQSAPDAVSEGPHLPAIAIVGVSCRFPGAPDPEAFWSLLREGREGIRRFSRDELLAAGVPAVDLADPGYVPARGVLDDVDRFDAAFFGLSLGEASLLDPQHRPWLECAWEALEEACCNAGSSNRAVGVFAGCRMSSYLLTNLIRDRRGLAELASGSNP